MPENDDIRIRIENRPRHENIDEFLQRLQEDEQADARLITPVAYGRLRGIAPQTVYYWIRTRKIEVEFCECGRKCIAIADADEILRASGRLAAHEGVFASSSRSSGEGSDGPEEPDGEEDLDRDGEAPEEP